MAGQMHSLRQFLTDDHRRLDALLARCGDCRTAEQRATYDEFRRGILKHIGIEEKILWSAATRLRGAPLEQAARLRLDHGAIVSLLMPIPTPTILRAIRTVLDAHNPIEEGPDGVYDVCEKLTASEHDELGEKIIFAPEVPTNPNATTPRIIEAAKRALSRAGYDPALLDE
jgi:hypothetical protein